MDHDDVLNEQGCDTGQISLAKSLQPVSIKALLTQNLYCRTLRSIRDMKRLVQGTRR